MSRDGRREFEGREREMGMRDQQDEWRGDVRLRGIEDAGRELGAGGRDVGRDRERHPSPRVSHRGKEPKGLERSDERLPEQAVLTEHHEIDASDIEVESETAQRHS